MENYIRKLGRNSIIISMILLVFGLFMFTRPISTINILMMIFGCLLVIDGLVHLVSYFSIKNEFRFFSSELAQSIIYIILGFILVCNYDKISSLLPIILGIWIIINSVTKFQYALVLKKVKNEDWTYTTIISLLTLIWGIVLLCNPFKSALAITQIIGVFIIVYAVLDIIDNFIIRKNIKDILNIFK